MQFTKDASESCTSVKFDESKDPEFYIEIFLHPGEYHWSGESTRIRTILGSCVAVCFWHPTRKIGGMCHFVLSGSSPRDGDFKKHAPAHFSDDAFSLLIRDSKKSGCKPGEFQVYVLGGGNLLPDRKNHKAIGRQNIESAYRMIDHLNLNISGKDLGGNVHRKVIFDLWSGKIKVSRTPYNTINKGL